LEGVINGSGSTRLYLLISNVEAATAPTDINDARFSTADEAGTTQDPRLVIDHTPPLSITSVTPSSFAPKTAGIDIAGVSFGASQGTSKVELSDNATYGAGTLVAQTVTSWSDTAIEFTAVQGALNVGTLYLFVTTDGGNTTDAETVTLLGPAITSVTPSTFYEAATGVVIAGTSFEVSQGTGKVELGDNATYGAATKQVQTVNSWSATSIDIDIVRGSLSPGPLWMFVTTDEGNVSAGFAVTLKVKSFPPVRHLRTNVLLRR